MSTLLSDALWESLRSLSISAVSKRAAVAYVTSDDFVAFGHSDTLVVDASDAAIANGQSDSAVLRRAFDRGARLYSCEL